MQKLERRSRRREEEKRRVTKKGQKAKIYGERDRKNSPDRQKCENWRGEGGGEKRRRGESLKRVKKRKYMGKETEKTHQIGKNAKTGEEKEEERRGEEESH